MFVFSPRRLLLAQIHALASQEGVHSSFLMIGGRGTGKRFIARTAAQELSLNLVELNLATVGGLARGAANPEAVLGKEIESALSAVVEDKGALLYLSNLERTEMSLHSAVHRAVSARTYVSSSGVLKLMPFDCVVIGGYQTGDAEIAHVPLDGWMLSAFSERETLDLQDLKDELSEFVHNLSKERGLEVRCAVSGQWLVELAIGTGDGLEGLRRWHGKIMTSEEGIQEITEKHFLEASVIEIGYLASRVKYRGRVVSEEFVGQWIAQFPEALRGLAVHIFREIATKYFIDSEQYFVALQSLVERCGIPANGRVRFCRWQHSGRSAPSVAHHIKNLAAWRALVEVDASRSDREWPRPDDLPGRILFVDDFVGSGRTLSRLWDGGSNSIIARLSRVYPRVRIYILIVAGYEIAIQKIKEIARKSGANVEVHAGILLTERDRCFSEVSRIFPREHARDQMRIFCESLAQKKFPALESSDRLGFNGIGALTVFPDTVPNNTLPPIWFTQSSWRPLFPASGLLPT